MTPRDVDRIMDALNELREWMSQKLEEVGVKCEARRDACRTEVFGRLRDLDVAQAEDRGYRQGKKATTPNGGQRDSGRNMLLLLGQAWKIVVALLAAAFLAGAGSEKLAAAVLSFFGSGP